MHAVFAMASLVPHGDAVPNIIFVGVPDLAALNRVRVKLERHRIAHYNWNEPDYDFGFTSIATVALQDEEREPLRNYRVWSHSPVPQSKDRPLKPFMQVKILPGEPSRGSSEKEQSTFS